MPLVEPGAAGDGPALSERQERARKIRPELTRGELVRVAWAPHQAQGELIQGLLLEEGVPSVLRRSGGADVPDFLAAGPRDVMVPESALEVARTALSTAEIEPSPPTAALADSRARAGRIALWLVGGSALGALLAWALTQLH